MITIKNMNNNHTGLIIEKDTPYKTILDGVVMLIDELVKKTGLDIDQILGDLKIIYERDNERK